MVLTAPRTSTAENQDKLTKITLVDEVSARLGMSKTQTKRILEAMLDVITESLAKDVKVSITGFGSFESRVYKARQGVNPQNGKAISIPSRRRPVFTAGANLKRVVKEA